MCQVSRKRTRSATASFHSTWRAPKPSIIEMENYPDTAKALHDVLVLPWNEKYTDEHVEYIAENVRAVVANLRK